MSATRMLGPGEMLVEAAERASQSAVTVHLRSGSVLKGVVIGAKADAVCLRDGERVTLVSLAAVDAVDWALTTATRRMLGMRQPRLGDNPTVEELKRRAQRVAAARTVSVGAPCTLTLPWADLPDVDDARGDLGDMLDLLHTAMQRIASEPAGAAALRQVRHVVVATGEVGVRRDRDQLWLGVTVDGGRLDTPTDLQRAMEAVL